jgi:predicted nucleotidyltransferase/uncharacterized protein (UPF0332 family)
MVSDEKSIPEMEIDDKYSSKKPVIPKSSEKEVKEMEKAKKELEKLKNFIVKKYPFTQALSLLPPQSIPLFIEEEEVPKETEKHMHLYMIIPEEKLKEIPKIKHEIVKEIERTKEKIWLHIKTPVDTWELCLDSKFELTQAVAMSFPLYDKGILGALRVAEIHKSLVLNKFEIYVVSYVIAGSLVRGEAIKTSDVDVFVVINDTDVKRMPRIELKERLRGIIYQYVEQASTLAGVKNKLSPQIYLLTDFWEGVKDAHPVMFTFIRDGIPLYDRGTFMPWKALLKMGKLKPSPEAIDMFMSLGENSMKRVKASLLDIAIQDIYWGVTTPSQAMLMLYGLSPPAPKHLAEEMRKIFFEKEKMLEKKYIDILEKIVKLYKDYEHEKVKEVSGKQIDELVADMEAYLKRLKELKEQIEKRTHEKTIIQIYDDVFHLLNTLVGKKPQSKVLEDFEKGYVKTGKFTQQHLRIIRDVIVAKADFKKGKMNAHKVDEARKNAVILINDLIEYQQRQDLSVFEKGKLKIKYEKGKLAEAIICNGNFFLIRENKISKIGEKILDSTLEELNSCLEKQKSQKEFNINPKVFEILKKELGDFEILL